MIATEQVTRPLLGDSQRFNDEFRANFAALAESRLRCNSYLALKNISCQEKGDSLILRGWVPTYYLKQLAQTSVADIQGVAHIINDIEVGSSTR